MKCNISVREADTEMVETIAIALNDIARNDCRYLITDSVVTERREDQPSRVGLSAGAVCRGPSGID